MPDGINIPPAITLAGLAHVKRWVAWQTQDRPGADKPTKTPINPASGGNAAPDKPSTWASRAAAEQRAEQLPRPYGAGGVGIILGVHEGLAIGGLDLDTCRDPETGSPAAWTEPFMAALGTYGEVSPSGTGIKLFFRYDAAALPDLQQAMGAKTGRQWKQQGGDHPPGVELYLCNRYFAVTDDALDAAQINFVSTETLLHLIRDLGPAAFRKPKPSGSAGSGDRSRSAEAMATAARVKGRGGSFEEFKAALDFKPDTSAWKAEKGEANGGRELRRTWNNCQARPEPDESNLELTEDGVARLFEEQHASALRFCEDTGQWHKWSGQHWGVAMRGAAFTWARNLVHRLNRASDFKAKAITGKASFAGAVETFAKKGPLAIRADVLDVDTFLLGTPGGTVDLRTGILRASAQADFITKLTGAAPAMPGTPAPLWHSYLNDTTRGECQCADEPRVGRVKREQALATGGQSSSQLR